jgi:general L-amino acid transport system permease protein
MDASLASGTLQGARRARTRRGWARWITGLLIVAIVGTALWALHGGLTSRGYRFDFAFLDRPAGIELSEGYVLERHDGMVGAAPFRSDRSNAQALVAGCFNTVKITLAGIVVSTVLGTLVGLGRLSGNWLLRQLCFAYVECVRNTPLLIQLVFWYFAVLLKLPALSDAVDVYGLMIASRQGFALPAVRVDLNALQISLAVAGLVAVAALARVRPRAQRRRWHIGMAVVVAAALAALFAGGWLHLERPAVDRFEIGAGTKLSPEWAALLLGLTVNTAAYIAEAVRGATEALPRGQWEAAAALGLRPATVYVEVIVPQVFRIVLPSLGNLYISLCKSTSFGIAVGYPDVFNVYGTIANQTGRTLEGIALTIVVYLLLCWTLSAAVNLLDRRLRPGGPA